MIKIVPLFFFLVNSTLASPIATEGETISANKFNSSSSQIGEIKHSILTVPQFQELNGDCWKLMDGSSLSGTDLGSFTGISNLPNSVHEGKGVFLRQQVSPVELGEIQSDVIRNITGRVGVVGTSGSVFVGAFYNYGSGGPLSNSGENDRIAGFDASRVVPTGDENRPKAMSVNIFIKVNKVCNFD